MIPPVEDSATDVTVSQLLEAAREQVRALKPRARSFGDFSSDMGGVLRSLSSAPSGAVTEPSASLHGSPPEEKFRSDAWANRRYQKLAKVSTGSQVGSGMLDLLPAPNRRLFSWLLLWACIILTAMLGLSYVSKTGSLPVHAASMYSGKAETLVIYTFSNTDPEYERNLRFLVQYGMWEGDGCEYLIIIQQGNGAKEREMSLSLPSNARFVYHENRCFDWGTFGWAIKSGIQDTSAYKYIIFMNSSVRGPFLPPYWPESIHWSRILTSRLNSRVKLVGSTISCEGAFKGGDRWSTKRQAPHVQSYVVATDQVGLKVLLDDEHVFNCSDNIHDAVYYSELGSSLAIFNASYTIDSLMLRYQDIDWRDIRNAECNAGKNPYAEYAYDGVTLSPMEVIFIKVKGFTVDARWTAQHTAVTYDSWLGKKGAPGTVNANDYDLFRERYRLGKVFTMQQRGSTCFDFDYYRANSPDLPSALDAEVWRHFLEHGQFEGRLFRFNCPDKLSRTGVAKAAVKQVLDMSPLELDNLPPEDTAELNHAIEESKRLEEEDVRLLHLIVQQRMEQEAAAAKEQDAAARAEAQQDQPQQDQPQQDQPEQADSQPSGDQAGQQASWSGDSDGAGAGEEQAVNTDAEQATNADAEQATNADAEQATNADAEQAQQAEPQGTEDAAQSES